MSTFSMMSDSELEVMRVLWNAKHPLPSAEIIAALEEKKWKPSTIWTFLGRLVDKGFLSAEKTGKRSLYCPLISEEEYVEMQTRDFLKEVHGGSVKSFFAALSGETDLSTEDVLSLKKWLTEKTGGES